jgi:triosephosphate isomerase (TIM)
MPRKIAAGNWKMHGDGAALAQIDALIAAHPAPGVEIVICPPATLIHRMAARTAGHPIAVGGQACHAALSGAHTGDIAAPMLTEAGASHVIIGHSERRADHGESDATIAAQIAAATAAGLRVILCVGETAAQYKAGTTKAVVSAQLAHALPAVTLPAELIVAYEPVWAIGTGLVAQDHDIATVHAMLREDLRAHFAAAGGDIPLLYGGSVKAANAAAIFAIPNVDGALVGGASLLAADFSPIIAALAAA